jgi:pimeloyl-ACP methyl ester carboxylesterase
VAHGVYYAVVCGDEAPYTSLDAVLIESAGMPEPIKTTFDDTARALFGLCSDWPTPLVDPAHNRAAVSDVPTLLLAGAFDPITPPAWARLAAEGSSQSYVYEFPAEAHDVLASSPCAQAVTAAFVETLAEPDADCLRTLPGLVFDIH